VGGALDVYTRIVIDDREGQVHLCEEEGVAERDELRRFLGRHDSGDLGDGENVALGQSLLFEKSQRVRGHPDPRAGPSRAPGGLFSSDVDHARFARGVDVGET